eukprot:2390355-Amphidinium_carterae.1
MLVARGEKVDRRNWKPARLFYGTLLGQLSACWNRRRMSLGVLSLHSCDLVSLSLMQLEESQSKTA